MFSGDSVPALMNWKVFELLNQSKPPNNTLAVYFYFDISDCITNVTSPSSYKFSLILLSQTGFAMVFQIQSSYLKYVHKYPFPP